jgi:hypothetical protein
LESARALAFCLFTSSCNGLPFDRMSTNVLSGN